MADDIVLTVRVRDMARGEFQRLDQQLSRMRNNLRQVGRDSNGANQHMRQLDRGLGEVQSRMHRLGTTGQITRRELQHMQRTFGLLSREALQARRTGALTQDQYRNLRNEIGRTRLDFDALTSNINLNRQVMRNAGNDAERLRIQQERLRQSAERLRIQEERLRQSAARAAQGGTRTGGDQRTLTVRVNDRTAPFFTSINRRLAVLQARLRGMDSDWARRAGAGLRMLRAGINPAHTGIVRLIAGFMRLGQIINVNKRWTAILIATLLLIGPAAQALGALLVTALGGAFIALGAFALRGEKDVRAAFNRMRGTVGSSVRAAAQPMRESLVAAMDSVGAAVQRMQPALTGAFAAAAPLIDDFVGAFTDFAGAALPGFTSALQSSGPAMEGFRSAMTMLGEGFGEMFRIMTEGSAGEALKQVWIDLGAELRNLLISLGEFISTAAQSDTATALMIGLFRSLTGILNIVAAALETLDPLFSVVVAGIYKLRDATASFDEKPLLFDATGKSLSKLRKELKATDKEIKELQEGGDAGPQGPAREHALNEAQQRRKEILKAIANAEREAAAETSRHAESVSRLIERLQSLADLNRNYLDSQAAQAEALNKAKEGLGEYSNALKMNGGQLDLTSTSAQEAYKLLSDLARATKETTEKAVEANAPWERVRSNWQNSFNDLVRLADGMGLSKEQARALAEEIVGLPPTKDVYVRAQVEQARSDIQGVLAEFEKTPDTETVTVKALTADASRLLESLGFQITRLPDGKTQVHAATGGARSAIEHIRNLLNGIDGKTATTYVSTVYSAINKGMTRASGALSGTARGGLAGYAQGGNVQFGPDGLISGPGSGMSDSIVAAFSSGAVGRVSNTEFVVNAASTRRYLPLLEAINNNRVEVPRFAKGGMTKRQKAAKKRAEARKKRAEAEREARHEAIPELTISHFGKMAGFKNDEFRTALAKADSLVDLVGSLNKWRSVIKKATHGGVEKNLLRRLDSAGRSLIRYEKRHEKVSKELDKAKSKLSDLRESAKQLRESVKGGVLSATNITRAAGGDAPVTVAGLMAQMRQGRDKSAAFSQALKDLKAKGVNKTIIEQIAEAGIEGGGLETAGALLSASGSELASINQMQNQINASAASAGKTAADAMYGAGIKAAEGLVKGLTKQQKAIEKAMMNIAKSMEKAIKRALGIKSPSKVMEKVGHFTAEGFVVGMEKNRKAATAWDSMLNVDKVPGAGSPVSAGGSHVIQLVIGNRVFDEIVLDSNRRTVRTHGGNVQAVYGRKP